MPKKILWLFVFAFAVVTAACVKQQQVAETHVSRGELFRTGNVAFDEFFEDVNALQKDTKTIKEEEGKAVAGVGKLLNLSSPTAASVFVAAKEKARQLAESKKNKAFLKLEGIDDQGRPQPGKQITVTAFALKGLPVNKDAQDLAAALDGASKAEGQLSERVFPLADKAKRRTSEADKLRALVETEFSSSNKRAEVERELDDAKKALADIAKLTEEASASASGFLRDSRQAFALLAEAKTKGKGKAGAKAGEKAAKPPSGSGGGDFNP